MEALTGRLKGAELLAQVSLREKEALEESVKRAEGLALEASKEKEQLNAVLETLALKHYNEKSELGGRITFLESQLQESKRPWYQQKPRQ